jgi:hypothetical protein
MELYSVSIQANYETLEEFSFLIRCIFHNHFIQKKKIGTQKEGYKSEKKICLTSQGT